MITQVLQFLASKRRLITEYLLLGCVVTIGGLAFSMYLSRMELRKELHEATAQVKQTQERLGVVELGYETNLEALQTLQRLRGVDNKAMLDLHDKYRTLATKGVAVEKKLLQLGQQNEDVKVFFRTSLNRALVCVLEPTQCGTDGDGRKD